MPEPITLELAHGLLERGELLRMYRNLAQLPFDHLQPLRFADEGEGAESGLAAVQGGESEYALSRGAQIAGRKPPEVSYPRVLEEWLETIDPEPAEGEFRAVLFEGEVAGIRTLTDFAEELEGARVERLTLAVGPRPGIASEEIGQLQENGFAALTLGENLMEAPLALYLSLGVILQRLRLLQ